MDMMKTQSAHPYSVFVLAMIATSMRYYLNVVDKKRSGAGGLPCPLRAPSGWRALSRGVAAPAAACSWSGADAAGSAAIVRLPSRP